METLFSYCIMNPVLKYNKQYGRSNISLQEYKNLPEKKQEYYKTKRVDALSEELKEYLKTHPIDNGHKGPELNINHVRLIKNVKSISDEKVLSFDNKNVENIESISDEKPLCFDNKNIEPIIEDEDKVFKRKVSNNLCKIYDNTYGTCIIRYGGHCSDQ